MIKDLNYITNYYSLPKFDKNGSNILGIANESRYFHLAYNNFLEIWQSFPNVGFIGPLNHTDLSVHLHNIIK